MNWRFPMEGELAVTDPETNAYHEAGHAFLAFYVGARVRSVTLEADDLEELLGPWMR